MDIARFHENNLTEFGLRYGPGHYHNYSFFDKFRDQDGLQLYEIKWNENLIQWTVNYKVIYQATRKMDSQGNSLSYDNKTSTLPFDKPFYLMLHVGVNSEKQLGANWKRPYMEIGYIRIFSNGENHKIILKKDENPNMRSVESAGSNVYYIVIAFISLLILIAFLFFLAYMRLGNKRGKIAQANIELFYGKVDDNHEYEEINDNVYQKIGENTEPRYLDIKHDEIQIEYQDKIEVGK